MPPARMRPSTRSRSLCDRSDEIASASCPCWRRNSATRPVSSRVLQKMMADFGSSNARIRSSSFSRWIAGDRVVEVLDLVHADEVGRQLEELGVAQEPPRQPLDPLRHRRREQQRLPLGRASFRGSPRCPPGSPSTASRRTRRGPRSDPVEAQRAAPQVIEHAARRAADDLPAGAELLDLAAHGRAAVDRHHHDLAVGDDLRQLGGDLQRQLARRQQHDGLHELVVRIDDPVRERDAERGGLPRAGARLHHQVAARHDEREGRRLHRHRLGEAHLLDRAQDVGVQAQLGEGGARFGRCVGRRRRGPSEGGINGKGGGECGFVAHGCMSPGWGEAAVAGAAAPMRRPTVSSRSRIKSRRGASFCSKRSSSLV